ncbi:MAG: ATP synthase F1 subunit epsilon [Fimbriimonadaceae bacterium]|nr:ATP synthase F1 subunit epsilon [Fimbriimonadaceae bacterium]
MGQSFNLSVVAPDRTVVDEKIQSLVAPGVTGYFGIMHGHEPMISALKTGLIEFIDASNQRHYVAIGGGFMEVSEESAIILADTAERASEIDLAEAEALIEQARKALRGEDSTLTQADALQELERGMNRIKAAKRA